jgi:hypothetical protein
VGVHACVDNSGEAANQENFCRSACLVAESTSNNHHHTSTTPRTLGPAFQDRQGIQAFPVCVYLFPSFADMLHTHIRTGTPSSMHESKRPVRAP